MKPGAATRLWQPNYYEHIVRNEKSLELIRDYIDSNPERWSMDEENETGSRTDRLLSFIESLEQYDTPEGQ